MLGQSGRDQGQLFYSFNLEEVVPHDHLVRSIADVLDLSWIRAELAPHYSALGRPSIDWVLMIRMLVVDYVFAIRSGRALCREVRVNLAYRWFCGLGIEDKVPDHSVFSRARNLINSPLYRAKGVGPKDNGARIGAASSSPDIAPLCFSKLRRYCRLRTKAAADWPKQVAKGRSVSCAPILIDARTERHFNRGS